MRTPIRSAATMKTTTTTTFTRGGAAVRCIGNARYLILRSAAPSSLGLLQRYIHTGSR